MKDKIKNILAGQIGVEPEDINDDDSFEQDLHMTASDLTDFMGNLEKEQVDISSVEISQIETVQDLYDGLDVHEEQ